MRILDCEKSGLFASKDSKSCRRTKERFDIRYGDSTFASGVCAQDHFSLGDGISMLYDFGLGTKTNSSFGVFALGIPNHEISYGKPIYRHNHFVMALKQEQKIERAIFSIWLNNEFSDEGELVFGGFDKAKFVPPLTTMKIVNENAESLLPRRFDLALSDIFLTLCDNNNNSTRDYHLFEMSEGFQDELTTALPDTGSVFTYLPGSMYESLISLFPERISVSKNKYAVQCPSSGTVSFKFGTTVISIPLSHFITSNNAAFPNLAGNPLYNREMKYCLLGFLPKEGSQVVLGHAFLRAIYTVFDLDMMQISMAPAIYSQESEIQPVTLRDHLPSVMDSPVQDSPLSGPEMLDPSMDFIADTREGFYKHRYKSTGSSLVVPFLSALLTVLIA
jgi:yapsin 1